MRVSHSWLCELLRVDPASLPVSRVAEALTLGGLEVEAVEHCGAALADVRVAAVVSSRPHPSSKNPLTLVTIDPGDGTTPEVVCGAPNVPAPGGRVAFAPVGATVLDKDGKPFTLLAKPLAGIVSAGMLCAEDELGLGTDHGGIVILPDHLSPGTPMSSLPGLVDAVLTLNVTPNRGDALSHLGVARDVAALLDLAPPALPHLTAADAVDASEPAVAVEVHAPTLCPRYVAATVEGLTVRPSPLALRVRLHRLGVRPINNLVDVTNLVMLETGQPLHAFDRRNVRGGRIVVRRAAAGEMLKTLDGIERALTHDDLVIADGEGPVALAGVMGGDGSAVADDTTAVVLEVASFAPAAVRRTARRLGMHTESSHRFERGTDAAALGDVALRAATLLAQLGGGTLRGAMVDVSAPATAPAPIVLRTARVEHLLGVDIAPAQQARSLRALGFGVVASDDGATLAVTPPSWRSDMAREVDLIEEVGRVYGFDKIPTSLPPTRGARAGATRDWSLRRRLRGTLVELGLDEAIFPVFIAARDIEAVGMSPAEGVRLSNPLSEERAILRPSLLPRLVAAVGLARRRGESRVRMFELGAVFSPDDASVLPRETTRVGIALAGPRDAWLERPEEVDFYDLKGLVEELCERATGAAPRFVPCAEAPAWAHPRAAAEVWLGEVRVGTMGLLHPDVVTRADLGRPALVAELDAAALGVTLRTPQAKAPPRFPAVRRDVALCVRRAVPAADLVAALSALAGPFCTSVALFDRYVGKELPEGTHSLAFTLTFRADDRSLQDAEVDAFAAAAVQGAGERFDAQRR